MNEHAKQRAVERGVMTADTTWDAHWNEHYKACAFRALFQPSPTLTDTYCRMLGGGGGGGEGDGKQGKQSSVGIHVRTGDDRTWNVAHSEPTDEHMRFADCAEGIRRAAQEAGLREAGGGGARAVDLDRWHVASDYQKVVDDMRAKFPTYVRSIGELEE